MIETTNNIIFWIGYVILFIVLLILLYALLYGLYRLLLKTPRIVMYFYTIQVKKSLKNATKESYKRWLNIIEDEYRKQNDINIKES